MCGIIGYIGFECEKNLYEGLKKLEYRGYDSSGMTTNRDSKFNTYKSIGRVKNLSNKIIFNNKNGIGIAHTRWATHGNVTLQNAHPHFSEDEKIAIVHNGIIENYIDLKEKLISQGVKFYGESDTEVIAKHFKKDISLEKFKSVIDKLKGTYAILTISCNSDKIFFAKNKSPLYIALDKETVMFSSDISCFFGKFDKFYTLEDGEYGFADKNSIIFYKNSKKISKQCNEIKSKLCISSKGRFKHFMLKEIFESKKVGNNILKYIQTSKVTKLINDILKNDIEKIYLIGCGSAYNAGLIGKRFFRLYGYDADCILASEFEHENIFINNKTLCIFISQSGETYDTLKVLDLCKTKGGICLGITNVEYSTLSQKSDYLLSLNAGVEKAVASTKAYLAQVVMCCLLAIKMKYLSYDNYILDNKNYDIYKRFGKEYYNLDINLNESNLKEIAEFISYFKYVFYIGKGVDYDIALEGSLKLKEISYIFSLALPCLELKHGTLALIDENTVTIAICSEQNLIDKIISSSQEIKARGGKVILLTICDIEEQYNKNFDRIIKVSSSGKLNFLNIIISLQKIAYYVATIKCNNPDMPKNLAKSVTVE